MNFSDKTIKTLEFDKITQMLADCAHTEGAKERALTLMPSSDPVTVRRRLRCTTDAKRLIEVK